MHGRVYKMDTKVVISALIALSPITISHAHIYLSRSHRCVGHRMRVHKCAHANTRAHHILDSFMLCSFSLLNYLRTPCASGILRAYNNSTHTNIHRVVNRCSQLQLIWFRIRLICVLLFATYSMYFICINALLCHFIQMININK